MPELSPADTDQIPLPDLESVYICPWDKTTAIIFADLFSFENINPIKQVQLLKNELDSFKDDLTQKISWIVCNKIDLLSDEDISQIRKDLEKELKVTHDEVFFISAATGEGTSELLKRLETELLKDKQK